MSPSVTGRRYALRASVLKIFFAQEFRLRIRRGAYEDPAAAGCVARIRWLDRPGDLHVIDQRDAVHVLQIQVARERLQRLVGLRRIAPQEMTPPTSWGPALT